MKKLFGVLVWGWCSLAHATMVFDALVYGKIGEQLLQTQQQLELLRQQAEMMKALHHGQYQWSDAAPLLHQINEKLATNKEREAVLSPKKNPPLSPKEKAAQAYWLKIQKNYESSLASLNETLETMNEHSFHFTDDIQRQRGLQMQVQNATGPTQAVQAAAQLASEELTQLQLIRQVVIAQTKAQSSQAAEKIKQRARQEAEFSKLIHSGSKTAPSWLTASSLRVPTF